MSTAKKPAAQEKAPAPSKEKIGAAEMPAIGAEIRSLRRARGLTLTDLSNATGLSLGYLSQVERGITALSVQKLYAVSRALGVGVQWFFHARDADPEGERQFIVRANARRKMPYDTGITDELLSPHLNGSTALLLSRLPPKSHSGAPISARSDEQSGFVLQGKLRLSIDKREFLLGPGDSFLFSSTLPFEYGNPGNEETVVVWVIAPPSI